MPSSIGSRPRVSRSCANCRAVRRRCDKQVPHCGQCIRTREVCAGYRDEWDLLFRDQTSHTVKRSKEIEAQKKSSAKAAAATPPPACSLIPNLDEIGVNYFFDNFVTKGSSSCGYLNYISTISSFDGQHSTLVASMAAVGLVTLANAARQPKLVSHARIKYSEAIQRVNLALRSPVESLKDSILMSVISLGVFENVSNFASWARHVQGAAALVVARGKSQFTSTAAILMFNQVRADMTVACVHGNRPFPEELRELQEAAIKHTAASSVFWILGVLATRHVNLLWKVRQNTGQIPYSHLLEEATVLQNDFEQVFDNLAVQEPYTTILGGGDPDIIFNGRYDLYHSTWAIRVWNNTRMLQMIVCNIIYYLLTKALAMDLTPALRAHIKLRVEKTLEIQSKLESDILATVPQALGYVSSAAQHHSSVDFTSPASVSGSYLLTWCLYTVGQSVVAKSKTRQWVIRHMQEIGKHAGIAMALQLVEYLVTLDELRRAEGEDDGLREFRDVLSIQSEESKIPGDNWMLSGTMSEISQSLG